MRHVIAAFLVVVFSAGVAFASAEGDGHGGQMVNFAWRIFNFTVFAVVIYLLGNRAIRGYFAGRREEIKQSIEEAERVRDEAREKLEEYNVRLEKASEEIKEISEMIRAQGDADKEKIIKDAQTAAEKMKEDAGARIDQEFKKAVVDLREEATKLSVEMAEEILRENISEKDHEGMVNDFLNRMVTRN
jgi:F-type H+-transporting ATPase subunit b